MSSTAEPGAVRTAVRLLSPKWLTARARSRNGGRARTGRIIALTVLGVLFWFVIIGVLYRILSYFKHVPEIGPLVAG